MGDKRILIVEDEALLAADLKRELTGLGYMIAGIAPSSMKAIRAVEEKRPDLVLMDIRIKGEMDGIETAVLLGERFGVPIVFLTAYADTTLLDRAKQAEPYGYLVKPVEKKDLHSTIEMALFKAGVQKEREELIRKLENALEEISTLRGLLPICSFCKKIKDDAGHWQHIETYIRDRSDADFTHSICPSCVRDHYPDLGIEQE